MAELLEEFPDCRFNIDLKSAGAVPAGRAAGQHRQPRPGVRRLVLAAPARRLPPRHGGRVATSATPAEVAAFRRCRSGRAARWLTRGRARPCRCRTGAGGCPSSPPRARTPRPPRRAHVHVWTGDEPGGDGRAPGPGVDGLITDRTDVLKEVLIRRGQWRDHAMTTDPRRAASPTCPARPAPTAEGLELVRLGQLRLRHDGAHGALRAVHDHRRRQGRRLRRRGRDLQQDRRTCSGCTSRPARCPST